MSVMFVDADTPTRHALTIAEGAKGGAAPEWMLMRRTGGEAGLAPRYAAGRSEGEGWVRRATSEARSLPNTIELRTWMIFHEVRNEPDHPIPPKLL
jgi:hypothetical protein